MKKLLLSLLVFPVCIFGQQQEVFRIDSLPKKGILLNQGWKWHAGDNPEWAKVEFDDSNWKFLPPLDLMDSLPQNLRPSGIRWFRLKLEFDKSLSKKILAMAIDQIGASEIYMNGKLLQRYGVVSSNPDEVKAFNPLLDPIPFIVSKDSTVILAVRYTYQNNVHKYLPGPPNLIGLTININTLEIIQSSKVLSLTRLYDSNVFRVGAFFILFISYFALYFYNPLQKANLFLCLFSLTILIADLIQLKCYNYHWTAEYTFFSVLFFFLVAVSKILLLAAVFYLMDQKINWLFGLLSGFILLSFFLFIVFGYHPVLNFLSVHIFPNLINLEIIRITLKAIQSQKKGAWIIALGGIIFLISVVFFVFMVYFNFIDMPLWGSVQTVGDLVYNVSWLSIPLAVAIYFGQEVAFNNHSLKEKLTEVEQLSAEKQLILSTQNETLERQVAERTTELSSKNRELEIEAALERVRSRTMAMQKSEHLVDVINVVAEQLLQLNFQLNTASFFLNNESEEFTFWLAAIGESNSEKIVIPKLSHPALNNIKEAQKNGVDFWADNLSFEEKNTWFQHVFAHSPGRVPEHRQKYILNTEGYARSVVLMKQIGLFIVNYLPQPYTDAENAIFKRFAFAFEQAYIRFLDLQKAEAQTREAEIELALERVRSRTMAMQHSDELGEAANLLFQQVQALGIPAWSCGYNIWEKEEKMCTGWMSSNGILQPPFRIPLTESPSFIRQYESKQKGEIFYVEEVGGEALAAHYQYMGSLPDFGEILKDFLQRGYTLPTFQINHIVNFKQGNMVFITGVPVPEAWDIFKRFAKVFEQTYTRFLDLQKAEAQAEQARLNLIQIQTEKKRAEDALTILKATQNQLIQSEKLASLGELTAGIAHEIQNPLNFVNNFSEVSAEMLVEMDAELDKGDVQEAKAISADLQQNLIKINHHGQRASSIVKGMLEHSRTSTGIKEPTDLNALADEYLRLAYHGLRAKDSTFNATMETHFDPDLPKATVIPQDIGRVLLNLINNAFYAVNEKAKQGIEGYSPTVTVSTKKLDNTIEITVKDNGNGIPDAIKDKIFQPFFTTKPTGQGTGLGLSLAYDIVTKGHGGILEVDSQEKIGTSFVISLPVTSLNH